MSTECKIKLLQTYSNKRYTSLVIMPVINLIILTILSKTSCAYTNQSVWKRYISKYYLMCASILYPLPIYVNESKFKKTNSIIVTPHNKF